MMRRRIGWAAAFAVLVFPDSAPATDWPEEKCRVVAAPVITLKKSDLIARTINGDTRVDMLQERGRYATEGRSAVILSRFRFGNWHEQCRFEVVRDPPVTVLSVDQLGELVFTMWVTGSAYALRAIDLKSNPPRQVLDARIYGWPHYSTDDEGQRIVVTDTTYMKDGIRMQHQHVWDGTEFTSSIVPYRP